MVAASIGSLNFTFTAFVKHTLAALLSGLKLRMVGAVVSEVDCVLKLHAYSLISAVPDVSVTAVLTFASQVVFAGKAAACRRMAILFATSYVTVLVTGIPTGQATVKLDAVRLDAAMSALNFAVNRVLVEMPVTIGVCLTGLVAITRGVMSAFGVPRIGSCPPDPPQATSKHDSVATKIVSLIKIFRLEHSSECIPYVGFEKI
jgi:hypothetical protein